MWINILQPGRLQMNEWRMRIACWIPKVTNKHSEYAERIAIPLPQWWYEGTSALRFKYVSCLV